MTNPNPFRGLAGMPATPEKRADDQEQQLQRERSIPAGDQIVTLSVRVRKRARQKLRQDAERAGISMQAYLERLILGED